jgi:hypothetical protein
MTPLAADGTGSAAAAGNAGGGLIPGAFHMATMVFQRARQLKSGSRPRVDAADHPLARLAQLEVSANTVSWSLV